MYMNILPQALNGAGSCHYADDAYNFYPEKDVGKKKNS